jgi:tyrosine-protein kinase Etk/Wzc|tara:strand:+ start:1817 stop:3019 length:1203 start_codon:yes stop_codon:yes gene_type:complete
MKLTPHEEKILEIIKSNPRIIDSPDQRSIVAKEYGLTEKTLRNRIAELKKRGLLNADTGKVEESTIPLITENDEINIKAILNIIIKQKRFVIKFSTFFMLIGLTYSLIATVFFESKISMYPAGENSQSGGMLGDYQGLAKSLGIGNLGNSPTYNIPDIINSRRLKKDIVLKNWTVDNNGKDLNLISYWELNKTATLNPISILKSIILPKQKFETSKIGRETQEAILILDELISVREEISGLISVKVQMQNPKLASDIANYIAEYVKNFISIEQKREATRNREFIEAQMEDAKIKTEFSEDKLTNFRKNNPLRLDTPTSEMIRERLASRVEENRTVYITLMQQFEIAKIDEAKEKLLVNILDIAEPAVKKSRPKRTIIVLLSIFGSIISSIPFAIYTERKT